MNTVETERGTILARGGLACAFAGLVTPVILWMITGNFLASVGAGLLTQSVALILGTRSRQHPLGKITCVVAGVCLGLLVAFAAIVLGLAESARRGAPM